MGHAAPISLGAGCLRLVPRRPGFRLGLFGGGPSAACSAEATGWWLPALAHQRPPRTPGRPWSLTLPVRAVLVLVHLRTNLTTRALAPLFHTANPPWTASFITGPPGAGSSATPRSRRAHRAVDHRRHAHPCARPVGHRHQQELPAQRQHPDHHLRSLSTRRGNRPLLAG